jgi:hypothetical protein
MSNGARHGIGVVVGLVVTAAVAVCLMWGTNRMLIYFQLYLHRGNYRWTGAAALVVAAVLIGLVAGTRASPVASLIPGVAFTATGALWVVAPIWMSGHTARKLPTTLDRGYQFVGPYGVLLILGVALLVASLAPSRWRARTAGGAPRFAGPPPAPMGPPPGAPGAPGAPAPFGAPQSPAQEQSWQRPPQYGQQPPAQPQYGQPGQYGQGGAQPGVPQAPPASPSPPRPAAGAVPFDDGDGKPSAQGGGSDEGVGEWTQMYGGDDLRGNR